MALMIGPKRAAGLFEREAKADTSHDVEQRALHVVAGMPAAAGCSGLDGGAAAVEAKRVGRDTSVHLGRGANGAGSAGRAERKADVVGGDEGEVSGGGKVNQTAVETLLIGIEMALEINKQVVTAKNPAEAIGEGAWIVTTGEHPGERAECATGQGDQATTVAFEVIEGDAAGAFDRKTWGTVGMRADYAQFGSGEHPAEITIAFTVRDEDVEAR